MQIGCQVWQYFEARGVIRTFDDLDVQFSQVLQMGWFAIVNGNLTCMIPLGACFKIERGSLSILIQALNNWFPAVFDGIRIGGSGACRR